MWFVIYEDKSIETEQNLEIWDNVSKDKKISKVGFMLSDELPPILLPPGERYCVVRTARNTLKGQEITGYVLLSSKGGDCAILEVKRKLITFGFKKTETLKIREDAWREGVN